MRPRILLIFLLALALTATAQKRGMPDLSSRTSASTSEKKNDRPGNAWHLTFPLGLHTPSAPDTATYNYQRRSIPAMVSDAWATTGNLGAEGINMLYFERHSSQTFFFADALQHWIPTFGRQLFHNVYTPTTIVSYNFAGNRQNHQDRLQADFAGNVNRRIGVGAFFDYLYSKGCYESQATKDFAFGLSGYYLGDRYEAQAFYQHYNFLNKENGGITDDLYITDPAVLQGGVDKIEAKSIPVRLDAAHSRLNGDRFFMTHAYKLGFWREQQVNDTLTRDIYVPVTRFIYSFDYTGSKHSFLNSNTTQGHDFWTDFYLNPLGTEEYSSYRQFSNALGIEMIEGFQKWARFGLSAYALLQNQIFRQPTDYDMMPVNQELIGQLTPLPEGFECADRANRTRLYVGGSIRKQHGSVIRYSADARFGLAGDAVGDIEASGDIRTRFRMLGDTVEIRAAAAFRNVAQSYLLQHYISNHFAWNNDFGKTRSLRLGGELYIPWTRTRLSVDFDNIQNLVYFNSRSLPSQHGGNIQVMAASVEQKFRFGIWNWDNRITWQTTTDKSILPLPALTVYSNMYLRFDAFKVLKLQIGVDCDYYTRYRGYAYQPATMTFHVQGDSGKDVGNFALCNLYATARLYKVRFYVCWSHFNQGWLSKDYFSLPGYPVNPRRLQLGLSVDFPD